MIVPRSKHIYYLQTGLLVLAMLFHFSKSSGQKSVITKLPIHILEASENINPFIIFVTGDGGWNTFSQNVTRKLQENKFNVIALDAREYFWSARTPEEFNEDIQSLVKTYQKLWSRNEFALVGYSFGADVNSFLLSRLPSTLTKVLCPVVLLSPSASTDFVVRVSDLIGFGNEIERKYKVAEALAQSKVKVACIFGKEEDSSLKEHLKNSEFVKKVIIDGTHRFNNDMDSLVKTIIKVIRQETL